MDDTTQNGPTDDVDLGPVDYLVVEFPADRQPDGSALPILVDLVQKGTIRVLDLAFVRRTADGSVESVEIDALGFAGGVDTELLAGASTGMLDDDDLAEAANVLEPGCSAALIVYENAWALPFARALRRNGADVVASGRIPHEAIIETLDALEAQG